MLLNFNLIEQIFIKKGFRLVSISILVALLDRQLFINLLKTRTIPYITLSSVSDYYFYLLPFIWDSKGIMAIVKSFLGEKKRGIFDT